MMRAAFGPVLPATSQVTVMLVYAEEKPSDFAREVPEGTRYVVKSDHRGKKFPGGCAPGPPLRFGASRLWSMDHVKLQCD